MAGWRGAIIGAILGLASSSYIAPHFPQGIADTLGVTGVKFVIALAGAWLGAFLGDLFGVVSARKH